ncbi:MAG: hypothetical protein LUG66_10975 [Clostridiales bacterium]|nr:hypothetical protein [Clostridiales bacterium]
MKLFKKITALALAAGLTASLLQIGGASAYAAGLTAGGWYETAYAEWQDETNIDAASVEYKKSSENTYTAVDSELIRSGENGGGRVDILGLEAGTYDVKVTTGSGETLTAENISVASEDRSGYAHFNRTTGVGAYNNDGTPKDNADIIYVTNETKNTVAYGSYTGLGNILKNAKKISNPLIIRVIGEIDTQTRDSDGTKTTDKNNGVVALEGLTDREQSSDSYFNMMDVSSAENITLEGVGTDASISKWGLNFSGCSGVEVKNLTFGLYPEDACSASGSAYVWVHRCTFNKGENLYDLTDEQDKGDGDGSTDMNTCSNVTISYCRYNNTHKSSLNGGSNSTKQYNYTYHHNYFNSCNARLPLTRYVNLHMYNNYTYNAGSAISARASAWVFSEANYYQDSTSIFGVQYDSSYGAGFIKSYMDTIDNSTYTEDDNIKVLTDTADRTLTFTANSSKHPESTQNFDTNSGVFYYDSANQVSKVAYLTDAATAKAEAVTNSGVMTDGQTLIFFENDLTDGEETEYSTIESNFELTPSNLSSNLYFKQVGDFSSSSSSRIRLTSENSLVFTVAEGATIAITASHASSTSSGTRKALLLNEDSETVGSSSYEMGEGSSTRTLAENLPAGTYTLTADNHINVTSVSITFSSAATSTTTTTEATTETTTETTEETTTEPTTNNGVAGDTDGNGSLTANDSAVLLSFITGDGSVNDGWQIQNEIADVNGDETLTAADAALILKRVVNCTATFSR